VTELQKVFLFYVFLYFLFKGTMYVALYVATLVVEKMARQRLEYFRMLHRKEKAEERERWKVAYSLYEAKEVVPKLRPLEVSELVTNPNSFTAYSHVNTSNRQKRYVRHHSGNRVYPFVS